MPALRTHGVFQTVIWSTSAGLTLCLLAAIFQPTASLAQDPPPFQKTEANGEAQKAQPTQKSVAPPPAKAAGAAKIIIGGDVPMQIWRDISVTPWAVLLCIHGLSLHSKSFTAFGTAMSHLGVPTYAMDVRGFGSWQNTDTTTRLNFEDTLSDIKNTLKAVRRVNPGLPIIIVGESMGGALALQAAAANPDLVDGLICSVPSRVNSGQKSASMRAALGMLYKPNGLIEVGDSMIKRATQQVDVAEDWENDPMTRKEFSPKELLRFRNLMNNSRAKAELITKTPVLFLQGGSDKLIKPAGTVALFNRLKTSDKDLVMVGTAQHLILEQGQFDDKEVIKDDVIALVTNWIDKHVANLDQDLTGSLTDSTSSMAKDADVTRQARGHFLMAEGCLLLNDAEAAKEHLSTVMHLARGTAIAQKADNLLLTLPELLLTPPPASVQHDNAKLVSISAAKANDKPTILVFCAPWIEPCKTLMANINAALDDNQDKVNIVWVDADKEENQALLDEYGIKPLPAVLYMSYKNEVLLYTLGNPDVKVTRSRIRRLLADDAKLQEKDKAAAEAKPSTP